MNQSQKILVQLGVALVAAGALGGYAYFGIFKKDTQAAKKDDHDLRLFAPQHLDERQDDGGAPPAEFTKIVVTVGDEQTVLEREIGSPWRIVSPVKARADKLVVDGLVSHLQTSKFKATLEEHPDAPTLAKYGLEPPQFVVEATAVTNGETRKVKLTGGIENTFDGTIYVRRDDESPVFTAPGGARFMLAKRTSELRDRLPFAIDESKTKRLTVKSTSNDFELARGEDQQWALVRPEAEPADVTTVGSLFSGAAQERAQRFEAPESPLAKSLGFDHPLVDVHLTMKDGEAIRLRVVRERFDAGDRFWGLREDSQETALAELGPRASSFDRPWTDLRDKALLRFRKDLVTRIVFRDAAGNETVVSRDSADASADSWKLVSPRAAKAKVFRVTGALWLLSGLRSLSDGEVKPKDWKKYGFDGKGRSITLVGETGTTLARFEIGGEVPNKANIFYVRGTRDQVLESDGARYADLPFTWADLVDEPQVDAGTTSP